VNGLIGRIIHTRSADLAIYIIALLLVGRQAFSYAFWAVIDIGVRLGVWPPGWLNIDAYAVIASMSPLHETAFVLACLTFGTSFVLLVLRSRFALHFLVASLVPGIGDWVMMTNIPQFMDDLRGYLHLIGHLLAICALYWLRLRGTLR
jgi:hypothetical protein